MKKTKEKAELYSSDLMDEFLDEITPEELERTKSKMLLAAKIDNAIKAKGWKKKDLAEALSKRPSEITKWLSGTHNFTSDTLWDIEGVLGIKLISLSDKKQEQVTNYFITVSQKPDRKSPDCVTINDIDELIPSFSSNYEA